MARFLRTTLLVLTLLAHACHTSETILEQSVLLQHDESGGQTSLPESNTTNTSNNSSNHEQDVPRLPIQPLFPLLPGEARNATTTSGPPTSAADSKGPDISSTVTQELPDVTDSLTHVKTTPTTASSSSLEIVTAMPSSTTTIGTNQPTTRTSQLTTRAIPSTTRTIPSTTRAIPSTTQTVPSTTHEASTKTLLTSTTSNALKRTTTLTTTSEPTTKILQTTRTIKTKPATIATTTITEISATTTIATTPHDVHLLTKTPTIQQRTSQTTDRVATGSPATVTEQLVDLSSTPPYSNLTDVENSTFLVTYFEDDYDSRDAFWPIAMALTIGIPTVIVFGVTIAVLYKRRLGKPHSLLSMYAQDY